MNKLIEFALGICKGGTVGVAEIPGGTRPSHQRSLPGGDEADEIAHHIVERVVEIRARPSAGNGEFRDDVRPETSAEAAQFGRRRFGRLRRRRRHLHRRLPRRKGRRHCPRSARQLRREPRVDHEGRTQQTYLGRIVQSYRLF